MTSASTARNLFAATPSKYSDRYASTVHSAQGLTSDKVLINLETRSLTTAKDVYYVAVSRARYEAEIFTDDTGRLPAAVMREADKTAALEVSQLQRHAEKSHTKDGPEKGGPASSATKPQKQKGQGGPELSFGG